MELADEGTLKTFTTVYEPCVGEPAVQPYICAFIMLDGAGVHFPHLLGEVDPDDVEVGMRVKAIWAEDRKGTLRDIKYFRPI